MGSPSHQHGTVLLCLSGRPDCGLGAGEWGRDFCDRPQGPRPTIKEDADILHPLRRRLCAGLLRFNLPDLPVKIKRKHVQLLSAEIWGTLINMSQISLTSLARSKKNGYCIFGNAKGLQRITKNGPFPKNKFDILPFVV